MTQRDKWQQISDPVFRIPVDAPARPSGTEPATGVEVNHDEATRIAGGWCSLVLKPNAHPHDKAVQVLARAYLALRSPVRGDEDCEKLPHVRTPPQAGAEFEGLVDEFRRKSHQCGVVANSLYATLEQRVEASALLGTARTALTERHERVRVDRDEWRRMYYERTRLERLLHAEVARLRSEVASLRTERDAFARASRDNLGWFNNLKADYDKMAEDALTPDEATALLEGARRFDAALTDDSPVLPKLRRITSRASRSDTPTEDGNDGSRKDRRVG